MTVPTTSLVGGVGRRHPPPETPSEPELGLRPDPIATASIYDDPATAFESFYAAARPTIGRAVALALGDVDLAAEATDEAMVRAYERWHQVSQFDTPEAWVYRVAMNWSMSALRRRRRSDPRLYDPRVVEMPAAADPAVRTALAELDVKHRSVVVCRHLLGWSVAETARALKLREGTVKSRLHRANGVLQQRLAHLRSPEEHR